LEEAAKKKDAANAEYKDEKAMREQISEELAKSKKVIDIQQPLCICRCNMLELQ